MSDNSTNTPPNAITIPVLIAFMISTAIFSCLVTLLVISIILFRRRRRRRHKALLHAKRKSQRKGTINPDPETPPMRTNSTVPISSPQEQQAFITPDHTPQSPNVSESVGPVEISKLIHEADVNRGPIEMMGCTTWSKGQNRQSSLQRHPSHLEMITTAITEERPQTG